MGQTSAPEELDTMLRHVKMDRKGGWRAKLDPVEWWYWFQGKRMDRFYGRHGPIRMRRLSNEDSARVGAEIMVKGRAFRKKNP